MRLRLRHAVAVTAVAVPLLFAPTAANAAPTSCTTGPEGGNGSYAVCTRGTGSYRAFVQCEQWFWPHNYEPYRIWWRP